MDKGTKVKETGPNGQRYELRPKKQNQMDKGMKAKETEPMDKGMKAKETGPNGQRYEGQRNRTKWTKV